MPRIYLSKKDQYELCLSAREKLECSWAGLARYLDVLPHTFDNWHRGDRLLPENIFEKLVSISDFPIKKPKLLPDNWGRIKGGKVSTARHGRSFWTLEGSRKGGTNAAKKVPLPSYSENLAEFVGIMLGDGGISRGQITVTLGFTTDKEYASYVIELIYKLFKIKASTYTPSNHNVFRIRASGVNLVKNLLVNGLVQGNKVKQQFDIPGWIQQKEEYIKACIRGLIDTDGCIHRKVRREHNGMEYRSIGITFSSYSKPLQNSLIKLFNIVGFKAAISGVTIYLCGKEQIERYIKEIGFSNPKHLNRYKIFSKNYGWVKVASENCLRIPAAV